jgi:cytochrome c oxidase assembly factor CtaG
VTFVSVPPLTAQRWFTSWTFDPTWTALLAAAGLWYLLACRRDRSWPAVRTRSFFLGLASVLVVKSCFLAEYAHTLFWALAVQDVLLLALLPVPLVLGRPGLLLRAALPGGARFGRHIPPVLGSLLATVTLLSLYLSGWDRERLERPWLFTLTDAVLLLVGGAFLGPLLSDERTSPGIRALIALVDGLLDAMPGLAVLGTHSVIARSWYLAQGRSWGPTLARDQYIGGSAMIALSELVGLPALLILLVQWVRTDAAEAAATDARLDVAEQTALSSTGARAEEQAVDRPWWENNPGPLDSRAAREGWNRTPPSPDDPPVKQHPTHQL